MQNGSIPFRNMCQTEYGLVLSDLVLFFSLRKNNPTFQGNECQQWENKKSFIKQNWKDAKLRLVYCFTANTTLNHRWQKVCKSKNILRSGLLEISAKLLMDINRFTACVENYVN